MMGPHLSLDNTSVNMSVRTHTFPGSRRSSVPVQVGNVNLLFAVSVCQSGRVSKVSVDTLMWREGDWSEHSSALLLACVGWVWLLTGF